MAAPVGPKKVHRYALEFWMQAVRLSNHPGIQTGDVAGRSPYAEQGEMMTDPADDSNEKTPMGLARMAGHFLRSSN